MTTRITTPTDDDSYPTTNPTFDGAQRSGSDRAQMMFTPTSSATAGQFDTEADEPR